MKNETRYDVVIAGGGPAGLSAALMLGRARKRVLLCDADTPRNAKAEQVHNFVTRDGTPPAEFRRVAHEQLRAYENVTSTRERVEDVLGEVDAFDVTLSEGRVSARRVIVCVGLIDELPELPGYRELWGTSIFQCPYCHGWEARDQAWGYWAPAENSVEWAEFLLGWTRDVVVFTSGAFSVSDEVKGRMKQVGIEIDERVIERFVPQPGDEQRLAAIEFSTGERRSRDVLLARPPQRQTQLVTRLGLALEDSGFLRISEQMATSRVGIFAAGDATTQQQGAIFAAAAGARAANFVNHELTIPRR